VAGKQNHLLLHPSRQPQHIHHLQPWAAQVESKMLMQEKPQKQNPQKHKFSKHTHTHTHIYIHIIYIHTYIRISVYKVTCEVHALATHTHTFIHFFLFFFLVQAPGKGEKEGTKRDRGPQVRARSTKTQSWSPRKVLGGKKKFVYLFQVKLLSVKYFAGHFRKQNICRSGHVVMFLLKCLLGLFFLNFIYLFVVWHLVIIRWTSPCITKKIKCK
jgi:hypothetical protein